MHLLSSLLAYMAIEAIILPVHALPASSSQDTLQSAKDAVPGESPLFTTYQDKETTLAAEYRKAVPATGSCPAGADDLLFQNLLAAEWAIYSFYQIGAEAFNTEDFTKLGFPNTTYERILQMRDNEAGHVRIFQDIISNNSVKPGPCKYDYNIKGSAETWLALQVFLEVSSMAFLTGLSNQADLNVSKSALMAIGQVESRHNAWALVDVWNKTPFSGPSDTIYPYPNQILEATTTFIVADSCPHENPIYPSPRQGLPQLAFNKDATGKPGSEIEIKFKDDKKPKFDGPEYFAVFYHGLQKKSVPYDKQTNRVTIPAEFDSDAGIIMVNIADKLDAPTEDSVVAGPLIILEQPGSLTNKINTV